MQVSETDGMIMNFILNSDVKVSFYRNGVLTGIL